MISVKAPMYITVIAQNKLGNNQTNIAAKGNRTMVRNPEIFLISFGIKTCYYVVGKDYQCNSILFNRQYLINVTTQLGELFMISTIIKIILKPFLGKDSNDAPTSPSPTPQPKQEPAPADNGPANAEKMANIECTVQEMIAIDCGEPYDNYRRS